MNIGLIDIDSKIPNLALMKISTYHKAKGDEVKFYDPLFDKPGLLYASKIFDFTPGFNYFPDGVPVIKGGTGCDLKIKLPEEIENIRNPDYSLYPKHDHSLQMFSRGCIRNCPFCVVRQKEGYIHPIEPLGLNPKGTYIQVMDNNFFANPEWKMAAEQLLIWDQPVDFQGVDVRILTDEHAHYLNKIKRSKQIHMAWDNPKNNLVPKFQEAIKWIKPYKLMCYVLIGYWSTPAEDLYRVEMLRSLKIDPFAMPFDKHDKYQRNFARWVEHKAVFKTVPWWEYNNGILKNWIKLKPEPDSWRDVA